MPCTIIEVTQPGIATVGGGGKHRAYQMAHDLTQLVGQERLSRLNVPDWPHRLAKGRTTPWGFLGGRWRNIWRIRATKC